jgi:hypothetical protein
MLAQQNDATGFHAFAGFEDQPALQLQHVVEIDLAQ